MNVNTICNELNDNGIVKINNFINKDVCDKIINDFHNCVNNMNETDKIYTSSGNYARLYNLNLKSYTLNKLLFDDNLMKILDQHFNDRTALNSTIFFHEGTQQCMHRDTPYFWSEPNGGKFVGVWFALEDINETNGKLEYIPKGHKIDVDRIDFAKQNQDISSTDLFGVFGEHIDKLCMDKGLSLISPNIKKGDVIIWHANLPHGGSKINEIGKTRYSCVAHYLPENSYVTSIDYFWGRSDYTKLMDFTDAINDRKRRDIGKISFANNDICASERRKKE